MSTVFILKDQADQYYSKSGEWLSEGDTKALFRTAFKDEVINLKVEISVKQPEIRVEIAEVALDDKGALDLPDFPKASAPPVVADESADTDDLLFAAEA